MISRIRGDISYALDDTVDDKEGEPRIPERYLQPHNTEKYLRMKWSLVDISLVAKWELHKPIVQRTAGYQTVEVLSEPVEPISEHRGGSL